MIRHIVLFKLKEGTPAAEGKELARQLAALLHTTGGLMKEAEVAFDVVHAHNSYDIVLNSVFENIEDLKEYQAHPEHVKVLDLIKKICFATVKADYGI
ncbi:MAG: Dabb family protein [Nitrospinae bacterium]|nr:Dabb family protein [Nitrospinota bacterium]